MRRAGLLTLLFWLTLPARPLSGAPRADRAQATGSGAQDPAPAARVIDAIAARVEDDIIAESEVRELAAFQKLLEGGAKSRAEIISELVDQWIVRTEAGNAAFPHPSSSEVDEEYARLAKQAGSPEALRARMAELNLTEAAARRILERQLYLSRFLDYKFRTAIQLDPKQIDAYYQDELAPQLRSRGQAVPLRDSVEDQIREVLTQREINQRSARWLDEAKARLRIDVTPQDAGR
jgi:hypothetical protein